MMLSRCSVQPLRSMRVFSTRAELSAAQQEIEERRIIDQAKKLFMKNEKTNETQAYRWFRGRAMQTSQRIVTVATQYLAAQQKSDTP